MHAEQMVWDCVNQDGENRPLHMSSPCKELTKGRYKAHEVLEMYIKGSGITYDRHKHIAVYLLDSVQCKLGHCALYIWTVYNWTVYSWTVYNCTVYSVQLNSRQLDSVQLDSVQFNSVAVYRYTTGHAGVRHMKGTHTA